MINTKTGVMEQPATLEKILYELLAHVRRGGKLVGSFVPESKNHDGPIMVLSDDPGDDVSIYHIEISENGIFPYIFDDGAS